MNTPDPGSYDARRDRIFGPRPQLCSPPTIKHVRRWRGLALIIAVLFLIPFMVAIFRGCK